MSALIYHLTEDSDGAWMIVFEPETLHLYIEFVRPGRTTNPARWMTIDDFLARRPRNPAHGRAIDSLVALLRRALGRESQVRLDHLQNLERRPK
ncbi:hypothetical protein [Mesorhizobium qingshengii]|uniref:Uncharacterized protein n=1 Tax=Mesorhizobium qingshengii TaxID=1165689 RepID=A0A1G5ZB98_9HYPH|nr:hypothetical protein [Mesorhizobium qingshengii]SDA91533.1 hypothetical protein SAMN02927914_04536 [Mesorhizobium qingshengii]